MRKLLLIALCGFAITSEGFGQAKASDVLEKLNGLPNQFNKQFEGSLLGDEIVMIYIPGANNPFQKIYFKQKGARLKQNTLLVGGFKEMMSGMTFSAKKKHLQDALSLQYKEGSEILIDMNSDIAQQLSLNGYSIITLSRSRNKVIKIDDFGYDRVNFFKALKKYEQPGGEEN